VPVYHDSEVAAIAFMLQRILIRRGFLDAYGNQVPVPLLARRLAERQYCASEVGLQPAATTAAGVAPSASGARCPECGARALRRIDGCTRCTECHYVGGCG
jgi:ribonucleoside-diphosphate reductase alpha chain